MRVQVFSSIESSQVAPPQVVAQAIDLALGKPLREIGVPTMCSHAVGLFLNAWLRM